MSQSIGVQSATRQCGIQTSEWTPPVAPSRISDYYEYYRNSVHPGRLASNVELENDIASMDSEYIEAVRRYRAEKSRARRENLLCLANLSVQNGLLPATEDTMTVIDRTLKRKAFKESIPQPILNKPPAEFTDSDREQEKIRARMLVQYDIEEWQHRENNLAQNQNIVLKQLADLLVLREKSRAALRAEILNRTKTSAMATTENLRRRLEMTSSRDIYSSTGFCNVKSITDKNRLDEIMRLRSGREVIMRSSKGNMATVRHPVLTVPHTEFSKESVYSNVHGANILNAPIIGNTLGTVVSNGTKKAAVINTSRFSGVIKLAGTDLRRLVDLQTIINAIPRRLKDVSLATDIPLKYRIDTTPSLIDSKIGNSNNKNSTAIVSLKRKNNAKTTNTLFQTLLPTVLPPPNMSVREYKQHLSSFKLTKTAEYERNQANIKKKEQDNNGSENNMDGKLTANEKNVENQLSDDRDSVSTDSNNRKTDGSSSAAVASVRTSPDAQNNVSGQSEQHGKESYFVFLTQVQVFNQTPPPNDCYKKQDAVIFLLSVIRGIITRSKLLASLEARRGLLDELILAQELKDYCESQSESGSEQLLSVVKKYIISTQVTSSLSSAITDAVNAIMIENTRNEQLQRAKAILRLASQERARREKAEITTRQTDVADRFRFNVRRREIQDAHSRIASLLIDKMAKNLIKNDAKEKGAAAAVVTVNKIAKRDAEDSAALMRKPMEAMRNLLQEFLLPEVDRRLVLQRLKEEEKKTPIAVSELHEIMDKNNDKFAVVDQERAANKNGEEEK